MNNRIWPKRLFALDVSRGLAALGVVLWHWQHFAYNTGIGAIDSSFDRTQQPLYAIFRLFYEEGEKGVGYFFVLSGFIFFWLYKDAIKSKRVNLGRFWVQRFSRLYPLHFLTLLLVALLQLIYIANSGDSWVYPLNDTYHFFLNLFSVHAWGLSRDWSFNGPTWTVSAEIFLYIVFFWVARVRLGNVMFCLLVSFLAAVGSLISEGDFITGPTPILQGLSAFFLGGVVYYITDYISQKSVSLKPAVHSVAIATIVLTLINFYIFDIGAVLLSTFGPLGDIFLTVFPNYILFPSLIASLTLAEIDSSPKIKQWLSEISWIGDITYSSYLLHFPLQMLCALAVSYGVLNADFYLSAIALIAFFTVLVPLSYATFIRFERPAQKLIRNQLKTYVG